RVVGQIGEVYVDGLRIEATADMRRPNDYSSLRIDLKNMESARLFLSQRHSDLPKDFLFIRLGQAPGLFDWWSGKALVMLQPKVNNMVSLSLTPSAMARNRPWTVVQYRKTFPDLVLRADPRMTFETSAEYESLDVGLLYTFHLERPTDADFALDRI